MLPIVLVLLVATSALAFPQVGVTLRNINDVAPVPDNGNLVSSYITNGAFELVDGGDSNIYILTVQQILNDLANQPDAASQALALAQTLAVLGELGTGVPGDACDAANLLNAYANYLATKNSAALSGALGTYVGRLQSNIDLIATLAQNPGGVRYSFGPRGNCAGGGRSYQFEAVWDAVLADSGPYQIGLVNEQYCATKRLYSAFNVRSNNVGAAVSAASIAPVQRIFQNALAPVANFFRAVISGGNAAGAAANAKAALSRAASSVSL